MLLACIGLDAPEDEPEAVPAADKPAPAASETDAGWPFVVKVALFGVVVAMIAGFLRMRSKKQAGYSDELA